MDMLNEDKNTDGNATQQGNDFIASFREAIDEKKLRRGMAGIKQILGDKLLAVKGIAQRVNQRNQTGRGFQRHQRNGNEPAAKENAEGAKEQQGQVRIFYGLDQHPKPGTP